MRGDPIVEALYYKQVSRSVSEPLLLSLVKRAGQTPGVGSENDAVLDVSGKTWGRRRDMPPPSHWDMNNRRGQTEAAQ